MTKYLLIFLLALTVAACSSTSAAPTPPPAANTEEKADAVVDADDDAPLANPITAPTVTVEPVKAATVPSSSSRCIQYRQDVRKEVEYYMGINFPWHYQMGCMEQESNCRSDIVSFDNGIGLFQLTPSTGIVKEVNKDLGMIIDPYNPKQNIKAAVYYVSKVMKKNAQFKKVVFGKKKTVISPKKYTDKCGLKLADIYQFYNGGYWYYYEAYKSGYSCSRPIVRTFCTRGGAYTDKAKKNWLSFCQVNYDYPDQIYKRGNKYKMFEFPDYKFY